MAAQEIGISEHFEMKLRLDNAKRGQNLSVTISGQNTHFEQGSSTINSVWFAQGISTIVAERGHDPLQRVLPSSST